MGWPSPDVPLNQTETTLRELVGYLNEFGAVPNVVGGKSVGLNFYVDGPSRGYRPADLRPIDVVYAGASSGLGSLTWTGASAQDSVDFAIGTSARSITTNGAGAQASFASVLGTPLNLTGKCLVVWIKRSNITNQLTGYPRLYLGDAALTNVYVWKLSGGNNPAGGGGYLELDGEWIRLSLPFGAASVTGAPSRASLSTLTIQVFDNSAGPVTFKLGGLMTMAEPTAWPNGVVSLTFDDGYASQFSTAKPYMDRYGYVGTEFVIAEVLWNHGPFPGYIDLPTANLMELGGWEVGAHAFTAANHNLGYGGMNKDIALADMQLAKNYLVQQGFRSPEAFAYPGGTFDANTLVNAARLYSAARTISSTGAAFAETFPPSNITRIKAAPISELSGIVAAQSLVTEAAANKEWIIFVFHDIQASASGNLQLSTAHFQALIDSINASGMPVRTISEVLKNG